jgi:hypothetical protein
MGATYGTLVTAPSHVEFDATDLAHTLTVEHAPAAVRAPLALPLHEAVTSRLAEPQAPVAREAPTQAGLSTPAVPAASVALPGELSRARDRLEPKTSPEPAAPTLAARPPREAIAAAVSACAAARHRPDNIRVTVTSSLKLKVGPNGAVESARFDPPLLPAIQSCAAAEIYKASLAGSAGSEVSIPIEFSY